jgi:predicted metal-dependent peptidase
MREKLRKMASNNVDWKKVLHSFCGRSQRANKSRTHRKVNRKYPYIHPGVKRGHTSNLAIYFDQSGSVSNEECELFFGALGALSKITTFKVFPFDYSVDEDNAFIWRRGKKIEPARSRSGGTSFGAVQKHFDEKGDGFDGLIILTDGEAYDPGPSRRRRCWVLLPNRRLMFDPHPGDIVVNMSFDD